MGYNPLNMNISKVSQTLIYIDRIIDYVPIVSAITFLFQKCVLACLSEERISNNHFFKHINSKSAINNLVYNFFPLWMVLGNTPPMSLISIASIIIPIRSGFMHLCLYYITKENKYLERAGELGFWPALNLLNSNKEINEWNFNYLKIASEYGDSNAKLKLALLYNCGILVAQDVEKGMDLLLWLIIIDNDSLAKTVLVNLSLGNIGNEVSKKKAFELVLNDTTLKQEDKLPHLGYMYLQGIGVERNEERGLALIRLAINLGNYNALVWAAKHYRLEGNDDEAIRYLQEAAIRHNNQEAIEALVQHYNIHFNPIPNT